MEREDIKVRTKSVIEEVKKAQYSDDLYEKQLVDLNLDSISFIKLLVRLETEFDITFGEDIILINQNTTVNKIIDCTCTIINRNNEATKTK